MRKKIVVVCGYGCELHPAYKRYLMRVANYVNAHPYIGTVIVSGGVTQQKSFPNVSEAAVMRKFLETEGRVCIRIIEDHEAFTSYANMYYALKIVKFLRVPIEVDADEIVIFCDAIRALKVKVIAERVFKKHPITMETYDLAPRGAAIKQIIPTLVDVLAVYIPPVNFFKEGIRKILARHR